MNSSESASTPRAQGAAHEDFVRRLGLRYLLVLLGIATLVAADQAVIQPLLLRMNAYAPVINVAGRQRMLSQKLTKAALAMQTASDPAARDARRSELRQSLSEWSAAHKALRYGTTDASLARIQSSDINAAWAELQPNFDAMHVAATRLIAEGGAAVAEDDARAAIDALVNHEAPFLATMERIVKLMEHEAAGELRRLRICALGIAATIVGLVIGLGWFVIRPALRAIRGQVDELEMQVALRTRELDETLASLRHEIGQRQDTEARNQALAGQLAHADRVESMGHLAAGLAHELNQPLGAIANYAEACSVVLAEHRGDDRRGRIQVYLRHILEASLRAGNIVRRIRNFVRLGASQATIVEMAALIREVVDLCRPEAARAEVEFLFEPPADVPVHVNVDPIQIQQVLVNLIQNAIQAMEQAPPQRRRLTVQMAAAHGAVQVDVIDGGSGLAHDDPETLFTPFQTTKSDGLGIGLSICRSIVEHHHGTIWARSLPSHGAQFSFVLPLAESHAAQSSRQADRVRR